MKTLKGPAIFLAQFASDTPPFNALGPMAQWVASLGYKGVQIPSWDRRLFDLDRAAESKTYCDELIGNLAARGLASPSCRRICKGSSSRCIRPTIAVRRLR